MDLSDTYITRIFTVFQNLKNINSLIFLEPSLATRIISFYNTFCIYLKYPILGVGIGNVENYIINQFLISNIPLTVEINEKIQFAILTKTKIMFNRGLIYYTLAQYGTIISVFFAFFHIKLIIILRKINKIKNLNYICPNFTYGLIHIWITLTIWFFYESSFLNINYLILYAVIIIYIYNIKNLINGRKK